MNRLFRVLLAVSCAVTLAAGELKIVKATYGSGDKVNDVTEALQKHMGGLAGIFLTIRPSNKEFGPDPAPRQAKSLTIVYTDGDAEKEVVIPERQQGIVVANAEPAQEFKVLRAFFGNGKEWNEVTPQIMQALDNGTPLTVRVATLGPDPAPRKKKELWVIYTQDNKIHFIRIPEFGEFSVESFKQEHK